MTPPVIVSKASAPKKKMDPKKLEAIRKTLGCIKTTAPIDSMKICRQVRGKA